MSGSAPPTSPQVEASAGRSRAWGALLLAAALAAGSVLAAWACRVDRDDGRRRFVQVAAPEQVSQPGREPRQPPATQLQVGERVPNLALPDLQRSMVWLHELRGNVVVLNVWASWCPPCLREMPSLQRLHASAPEGVAVVSVCVDDSIPDAQAVAERFGITFPVLLDPGGARMATWGTVKYPETWILDAEGVVIERVIGATDWTDPAWVRRLSPR